MLNSSNMTPINNESVVQQVINKIMDAIIAGELKPGEKIPTELELIELLHVSRNSLRSAIQTLRAYGVLEVRRPEGTFVCDKVIPQLLHPMIYTIMLSNDKTAAKDIVDLRLIIDFGVSTLIIRRGLSKEDEARLEAIYADMVDKLMAEDYDLDAIVQVDMDFHVAMAEATHNSMVVMLNKFLLNLTSESRYRTIRRIFELNDREYLVKTHRIHLDVIEGKPGTNLEEALEYSYLYWKDSYNCNW